MPDGVRTPHCTCTSTGPATACAGGARPSPWWSGDARPISPATTPLKVTCGRRHRGSSRCHARPHRVAVRVAGHRWVDPGDRGPQPRVDDARAGLRGTWRVTSTAPFARRRGQRRPETAGRRPDHGAADRRRGAAAIAVPALETLVQSPVDA